MAQVQCGWCINWNPDDRDFADCPRCNGVRKINDPKEILCNLCGGCMCPEPGSMNEQVPFGLYNAKVDGGYESYHLFDMTRYTFSFCEKCLRELFIKCKIKPIVSDLGINGNLNSYIITDTEWERDQEAYEYREWIHNGGLHQAYMNKKCNQKKDCPNDAIYTIWLNDHFTEECSCEEHKRKETRCVKYVKFIAPNLRAFL